MKGQEEEFQTMGPQSSLNRQLYISTNLLPWGLTIPNLGLEYAVGEKWSVLLNVDVCPWKMSDKFSVKTVAILPEGRWWLKSNRSGSFFNVHFNLAWFNVRSGHFRYQDTSRPLLGGGIGYGYRLELKEKWGLEFEIGAGMANMKYDRFHNVKNGALIDTRVSTYWGIDRVGITLIYNLCEL